MIVAKVKLDVTIYPNGKMDVHLVPPYKDKRRIFIGEFVGKKAMLKAMGELYGKRFEITYYNGDNPANVICIPGER